MAMSDLADNVAHLTTRRLLCSDCCWLEIWEVKGFHITPAMLASREALYPIDVSYEMALFLFQTALQQLPMKILLGKHPKAPKG